jgi:hypothetical protein
MNVATGAMTRLSPADAPTGFFTNYNEFAHFTPDGRHIIFARTKDDKGGGMDYWSMRPDGTDVRRLTFTGADWHTQHQGYGNVLGFAFDPHDPNRIFANRTTDLASHNHISYFVDLATGGLRGTYYTSHAMTRTAQITAENPSDGMSFDPQFLGVPTSGYVVRWTGRLTAPATGGYTFTATTDSSSSIRITIDGKPLAEHHASVTLRAGAHTVSIEYVNGGDNGYEQMLWQPPGAGTPTQIPVAALSS